MSKRGQTFAAALAFAALIARPSAQAPSLDTVLKRTAAYVAEFRKQLSGIAAEETYVQEITHTARSANTFNVNPPRTLKSDLLLVKLPDSDRYVELRDVFEVDGEAVRDRQPRLERLLNERAAGTEDTMAAIITESAKYNIGRVTRTINTPLMALQFLDASNQSRFTFKHVEAIKPVFTYAPDAAANDTPVFRVSTEMWTVEFQERKRNTIIRTVEGGDLPAHGRFWIDPSNGSVLISELIVDTGGVIAAVTVSYQTEPLMGFLVPIEMRESYLRAGERITGRARYGQFRQIH